MSADTPARGMVRVLGISGSLRAGSRNTALLRAATALAEPAMRVTLWDGLADVPPFNADHEQDPPAAVQAMRAAIDEVDGVLISTPEYNTTVPGQLKNALDWASRPDGRSVLLGKPIAVIGASPSDYGAAWSQETVRRSVAACGARVIDLPLCVPRAEDAFGPDGQLRDATLRGALAEVLDNLGRAVHSGTDRITGAA